MTDYLCLKWGTLKGYNLENEASRSILQKYLALGHSLSVMLHVDTPEQKQLLCELIRQHEGEIYNDWSGENYSKDQAIDYITNYGNDADDKAH